MNEVEKYISSFSDPIRQRLQKIRTFIFDICPQVEEGMAYGMPSYKTYKKPLIYFAGYDNHVGLYALPSGHSAFEAELKNYKQGKGSVQFPNNLDFPEGLIERMIKYRVEENERLYKK